MTVPLLSTWVEFSVRYVCVFLYFYVQSAYVWLKFYWNFYCKGGLNVILVRFVTLLRQLFLSQILLA
jgi:hypothetical protein